MIHEYKLKPAEMEMIEATRQTNKWEPGFTMRIVGSKEVAEAEDRGDRAAVQIYTDGSGLGGKIGASAVLIRSGKATTQVLSGDDKEAHSVRRGMCGVGTCNGVAAMREGCGGGFHMCGQSGSKQQERTRSPHT